MKKEAKEIRLTSLEDLFGLQEDSGETVREVSLAELHPFKNHPFHVTQDEEMKDLAESIRNNGVLNPGLVRPDTHGGYEIISGHRRKCGCQLAGLAAMPVIVRDLTDDEATIIMVDSVRP